MTKNIIVIRGGGDLASGIAVRLWRAGFSVVITELEKPLAVRRTVSFCEAVYESSQTVESITARLVEENQVQETLAKKEIPVLIDPEARILQAPVLTKPDWVVVVDARLLKKEQDALPVQVGLHIGLGPGFTAGFNCDAVIETNRGHTLGRVYWHGSSLADSGLPEGDTRRVLRAPQAGIMKACVKIGDRLAAGQLIARMVSSDGLQETDISSPFEGMLRGLIRSGIELPKNIKIGDVDARKDSTLHTLVSDKALAIGGGVLEALLASQKLPE